MEEKTRNTMEQMMGPRRRPEDFRYAGAEFQQPCKAKDIGLDSYLECLEQDGSHCKFGLSLGYAYFCQCPVRAYVFEKLKK